MFIASGLRAFAQIMTISCLVAWSAIAFADQPIQVNIQMQNKIAQIPIELAVGFGPSLPAEKENAYRSERGPNRSTGGETISVRFREPKNIARVKLTAFSKSGRGKVLIREVSAKTPDQQDVTLANLSRFDQANGGENHNGLVMLVNGASVSSEPVTRFASMDFKIEGYSHNDSTLLLELESQDSFAITDFVIRRSGGETIGEYFDEANYQGFSGGDLRKLMREGATPSLSELAGTTWVCSSYGPRSDFKEVDHKTRQYFSPTAGLLQSTTDLDSDPATWIQTQIGWRLPIKQETGNCGPLTSGFLLRKTAGGNLVSELITRRSDIYRACEGKGWTRSSIDDYLARRTDNSVIDRQYVVNNYEFCRPAGL